MNMKGIAFLEVHLWQTGQQTSADGIEFMDPELKTLKAALETVRDTTLKALSQIDQSQEQRSLRWRCKACRYTKYFTMPVNSETAGRCPGCKNSEFRPVL